MPDPAWFCRTPPPPPTQPPYLSFAQQIQGVDDAVIAEVAAATEGFSGREIAKFMISVQAAVYGRPDATLTPDLLRGVLRHKLHEHSQRQGFKLGHHGAAANYKP